MLQQAALSGQHPFQIQQSRPEPSGVYSSCSRSQANSIYKRLLHRSLHKSSRASLMKVYDPGHGDLHTSYDSAEWLRVDAVIYFHLVSAGAEGTFYTSLYTPSISISYYRKWMLAAGPHHKNISIGFCLAWM